MMSYSDVVPHINALIDLLSALFILTLPTLLVTLYRLYINRF